MSADIHTLTGAYALNALTADEVIEFERHMATCPACAQEVAELRETAACLGAGTAQPPPDHLRHRVMQTIGRTRQDFPALADAAGHRARRPRWATVAVAAAAVLLAVLAGVQTARLQDAATTARQYDRITALLTAPDARVTTARAGDATGTVVASPGQHTFVLLTSNLPALPPDRTYQAWIIGPGDPASVGLITDPARPAPLVAPLDTGPTQVGITVEPAGGSARPTTSALMLIPLST